MMTKGECSVHKVAGVLVWVGAINWGLMGFFKWNLVNTLFGGFMNGGLETVIYMAVGLSAVAMLFCGKCKQCKI